MEQSTNETTSFFHQEKVGSPSDKIMTLTPKFLRRRKFFMVLPLLVLPFMTHMFWALGGGKMEKANAQVQTQKGINLVLPDAYLKEDKSLNKMSYYNKAALDSAKVRESMKNDPYYSNPTISNEGREEYEGIDTSSFRFMNTDKNSILKSSSYNNSSNDPNEAKIYQKLDQLNKVLNNPSIPEVKSAGDYPYNNREGISVKTADVDRLEQMMQTMAQSDEDNAEMQQLNGMLEKILDIQHPDRIREKISQASDVSKRKVFTVSSKDQNNLISTLDKSSFNKDQSDTGIHSNQSNAFYSLNELVALDEIPNAIEAVIHETQTLVNGSTVKLRLLNDIFINGVLIPKDNFLFGTASLEGERLNIKINSLRFRNSLFPVDLTVYDMDGINGIYIPGAISRDVVKQSADRTTQGFGVTTLDPSLGAQAATAGIETARNLLGKKARLTKVTVKAGYRILLKNEQQ